VREKMKTIEEEMKNSWNENETKEHELRDDDCYSCLFVKCDQEEED
jgi:hypothetical protein